MDPCDTYNPFMCLLPLHPSKKQQFNRHIPFQEPIESRQTRPGEVVGQAPEIVESDRRPVLDDKRKTLENDISEYLLLHHNYAAKPPKQTRTPGRRKLKAIRPKVDKLAELNTPVIIDEGSSDVLYTFGSDPQSVTIVVDSTEENAALADSFLAVPSTVSGDASPRSISSSDNGYESLDSPQSVPELDIWDQSMSELFPNLF